MPMVSAGFTAGWFGEAFLESDIYYMDEADKES